MGPRGGVNVALALLLKIKHDKYVPLFLMMFRSFEAWKREKTMPE